MIKAVIFDCFGVLASDGWLPFKNKYFGENGELWAKASELNRASDAGLIGYEEFLAEVARMAGVSTEKARYYIEHNVPDEKIFGYIRELKADYKIGMLSNASGYWLDKIFTDEQVALFDAISLSYETGFVKPDPGSYESILKELSVKPAAAVFIDDQARYCEGGRASGIKSILYENFPQLKGELSKILAARSDN
jgi:putative hydrolase of the HAD superfamily